MNKYKYKRNPPIIVSAIVALIFLAAAVFTVNQEAAQWKPPSAKAADAVQPARTETASNPVKLIHSTTAEPETVPFESANKVEESTNESANKNEEPSRSFDSDDEQMLQKIAMAEAEGESVEGKALIMLVVLNRTKSDSFPDTVEEVIFQKNQFSPTAKGGRYWTTELDAECASALSLIKDGWDKSQGALYFDHAGTISWASQNRTFLFRAGNHNFYR